MIFIGWVDHDTHTNTLTPPQVSPPFSRSLNCATEGRKSMASILGNAVNQRPMSGVGLATLARRWQKLQRRLQPPRMEPVLVVYQLMGLFFFSKSKKSISPICTRLSLLKRSTFFPQFHSVSARLQKPDLRCCPVLSLPSHRTVSLRLSPHPFLIHQRFLAKRMCLYFSVYRWTMERRQ